MDNSMPELFSETDPTMGVPLLVPRDDPRLNPAPIARLFAERGEAAAEPVIGGAMDELSQRFLKAETFHRACRFGDLARLTRSMVGVAEGIGFNGVAHAASQVTDCALNRDATALAATMARLGRLTEQSLAAIWDLDPGHGGDETLR